ncbi:uncharacterized protein EI97DRAFT_502954 [Westerdykella ornata]|uniref:Polymerase beta nucleotidyltransferase domain-containing protein n=1 Tax=Westerdykella ornata TaxID=318751 RepID=A0A6A6JEH5_WESOR|nr:uncharacterized protein EI97DRAFT_502954 [Westerdykella ornata]KAF2274066.1 hypothetical protein EI97DRAFT_502954 [Westerdykella ornata]
MTVNYAEASGHCGQLREFILLSVLNTENLYTMYEHHAQSIENIKNHLWADPSVLALLLSGSIAHGFENAESDVDILIVLSDEDYANLLSNGRRLTFKNFDLCTYEGGFFDGKYISIDFIRRVAARGSEPARFGFEGAKVLFSRVEGLEQLLKEVVTYPVAEKRDRIVRFRAQLEGWHWYCSEAKRRDNPYLLSTAVSKLVLFGTRLVLAHNEMLYPFHKWMLKVLEQAPDKPDGMLECIDQLCRNPTAERVETFYEMVKNFRDWEESPNGWGSQYMLDVELNWMDGTTPVDDL